MLDAMRAGGFGEEHFDAISRMTIPDLVGLRKDVERYSAGRHPASHIQQPTKVPQVPSWAETR